jgi:hypothetical protein
MSWIDAIQASRYAAEIRDSTFIYPLLQVVHIMGIATLAGIMIIASLRTLGVGHSVPMDGLLRLIRPVAIGSVAIAIVTGLHMSIGFIDVFTVNPVMWAKLSILAVLLLIATRQFAPLASGYKVLAVIALVGWPTLIVLGKLLAYIGGKD